MNKKKQKLTTFQRWIVIIGMASLILTSAGLLIRNQLLDPGDGGVYIPTDPEDIIPVCPTPEISLSSIKVRDIDGSQFSLAAYVTDWNIKTTLDVAFYVNNIRIFESSMGTPTSGYYMKDFFRTQFPGVTDDSLIVIYLTLEYQLWIIENLWLSIIYSEDYWNPIDGFSFGEVIPEYNEPEIIEDTLEKPYDLETEEISFSFLVSDFELVNSIYYHFVVDNEIIKDPADNDIIIEMDVDENGKFSSSFDYTQFDLTKENWVYLTMNFINEDGDNKDKTYDKFFSFQYGEPTPTTTPTNGGGINYLFIITIPIILVLFSIIRKRKKELKKVKNNG